MTECGFIGLGRMGGAMARRLLASGRAVVAYDVSDGPRRELSALGARVVGSARAVGDLADVVFLSLPTPTAVLDALLGDAGVRHGRAVEVCVDLSTSGPQTAIRAATGLAAQGIQSIEAPVSGGISGARDGKLSLMVSGPSSSWERVRPLLEIFGRPYFMGEAAGAGQTMKLVNNLLGACAIAITAEGMTIGAKAGLDPHRMIDVLNASTGRNSATEDKWPRAVLPRTFDFGFAAGLCLKDVRLCREVAQTLGVPLEVGAAVAEILERAVTAYGADADFTSMAKIVESDAGLDPERTLP